MYVTIVGTGEAQTNISELLRRLKHEETQRRTVSDTFFKVLFPTVSRRGVVSRERAPVDFGIACPHGKPAQVQYTSLESSRL